MYSLQDFGTFILYFFGILAVIVGIIAIIFIINTLISINKLIKRVDGIIEENEKNITKTVDNVNEITTTVKYGVDKVESTTQAVEESICDAIINFSGKTDGFFDFITISKQVLKTILGIFPFNQKK